LPSFSFFLRRTATFPPPPPPPTYIWSLLNPIAPAFVLPHLCPRNLPPTYGHPRLPVVAILRNPAVSASPPLRWRGRGGRTTSRIGVGHVSLLRGGITNVLPPMGASLHLSLPRHKQPAS
jgi:hypothetical protein